MNYNKIYTNEQNNNSYLITTTRKNFQLIHHFIRKATFWLEYAQCVAVVIATQVISNQRVSGSSHQLTATCLVSVMLWKCLTQSYILQFSH